MRQEVRLGLIAVAGAAAVAAVAWMGLGRGGTARAPESPRVVSAAPQGRDPASERFGAAAERRDTRPALPPLRPAPDLPVADAPPDDQPLGDDGPDLEGDAIAQAWSAVDLDAVRAAMPDNVYWKLSAPTTDQQVLEERAAERARWNVEYGKILSGTASEEEIRAYFDQRARLSADYIEFATHLLDHYGDRLPERDVGLLKLARRLHAARMEELPRQIEEALERKRQQDAARAAWLADQAVFGAPGTEAPAAPDPGTE